MTILCDILLEQIDSPAHCRYTPVAMYSTLLASKDYQQANQAVRIGPNHRVNQVQIPGRPKKYG